MHIGIDATIISRLRNGVGVYAENLIRELIALESGHELSVFVQAQRYDDLQKKFGAKARVINASKADKLSRLWFEQVNLPRAVSRLKINLLHSVNMTAPVLKAGAKSVVTVLDLTTFTMPELRDPAYRLYMNTLMAHSVRHADRLISISEYTTKDIQKVFAIPAAQIDTIPLAFDPAVVRVGDETKIAAVLKMLGIYKPYLLYVGRLDKCKNLPRLVEAFAAARAKGSLSCMLVLAGRPWNDSVNIQQTIEKFKMQEHVRLTGHVADDQIAALYSGALGFVFPSIAEGFGIPILEAMACDVPVLTARATVLPEVAGDAALYVDPYSVADMTDKLLQLLNDASLRGNLVSAGRERLSIFSWSKMARQTLMTYEALAP